MCGIVGFFNSDNTPPKKALLHKMAASLKHRGPDGLGFFSDSVCALGHARLSLIDAAGSSQPLFNEDGNLVLICNGEIYNYIALRNELIQKGHFFRTNGDAEVILHLYEQYQEKCLDRLIGMFVFAIWDRKKKELFLARDQIGVKPLYYTSSPKNLFFASEIGPLIIGSSIPPVLNSDAISTYLARGYIPEPNTVFSTINCLPAGHFLKATFKGTHLTQYWDIKTNLRPSITVPITKCARFLRAHLEESVFLSMKSDSPVGVFLSGGLDSSTLVACASRISPPLQTFSIAFEELGDDETSYSRQVAKKFGTKHRELLCSEQAVSKIAIEMINSLGEPFGDPATLPTYLLSGFAKTYVKGVLSGEGSDELFAGSPWHVTALKQNKLDNALLKDLSIYLPSYLLFKTDRASMAHGLEVRVPYLNQPFLKYALTIPSKFKISRGISKRILKLAFCDILPTEVISRAKHGLSVPIDLWLWRKKHFRRLVEGVLWDQKTFGRGYIDKNDLKKLFLEHDSLRVFHGTRIWRLFVLEIWHRSMEDTYGLSFRRHKISSLDMRFAVREQTASLRGV